LRRACEPKDEPGAKAWEIAATARLPDSRLRHRALPPHEHPARYCTGDLGDIGAPVDIDPMGFSGWSEVYLDGRWWTMDARRNHPRPGRIVMGRGRDAAEVPISMAFGVANLVRFDIVTGEQAVVRLPYAPLAPRLKSGLEGST
jgi:hypothetical protein